MTKPKPLRVFTLYEREMIREIFAIVSSLLSNLTASMEAYENSNNIDCKEILAKKMVCATLMLLPESVSQYFEITGIKITADDLRKMGLTK